MQSPAEPWVGDLEEGSHVVADDHDGVDGAQRPCQRHAVIELGEIERVRKVAASEGVSEEVVRSALHRQRRNPAPPVAQRIWQHDGTSWVLMYDVEHDPRCPAGDQRRDQQAPVNGAGR